MSVVISDLLLPAPHAMMGIKIEETSRDDDDDDEFDVCVCDSSREERRITD